MKKTTMFTLLLGLLLLFVTIIPSEALTPSYGNYQFTGKEEMAREMFHLVNELREENGVKPLTWRSDLAGTADFKNRSMYEEAYFSHSNPHLGQDVGPQELAQDYLNVKRFGGENLLYSVTDSTTAEALFQILVDSPSHRALMLDERAITLGVAVLRAENSPGGDFPDGTLYLVTQHFGE